MSRIELLKNNVLGITPQICSERALYYTNSWRETEEQPVHIRRALALKAILENQTISIRPGELIVGNQAGRPVASPIFPEYGMGWLMTELDDLPQRRLDKFLLDKETKDELIEIATYWNGKSHFDYVKSRTLQVLRE